MPSSSSSASGARAGRGSSSSSRGSTRRRPSVAESGFVRPGSPGADRAARAKADEPDAFRAGQLARTPGGHAAERAAEAVVPQPPADDGETPAAVRFPTRRPRPSVPRRDATDRACADPRSASSPTPSATCASTRSRRTSATSAAGENQNFGESIQFDSKGVEFGPWLARFIAQVRANWMIPQAAMSMHGHVAITLVVHKDGRITDVAVAKPSAVNAFTLSGRNAILTSNPTIPLPPEYPDDRMPITVTFFFNEYPPGR